MNTQFWTQSSGTRKFVTCVIFCLVSASVAVPATHAIVNKYDHSVAIVGIVSDSMCGARHGKNTQGDAECTRLCVKLGASYALAAGKKVYFLEGHRAELDSAAGESVTIRGRLAARDTVYVESVVPLVAQAMVPGDAE